MCNRKLFNVDTEQGAIVPHKCGSVVIKFVSETSLENGNRNEGALTSENYRCICKGKYFNNIISIYPNY